MKKYITEHRLWVFVVISLLFLILSVLGNLRVIHHSHAYKSIKEEYAQTMNFRERLLDPNEWVDGDKENTRLALAGSLNERSQQEKRSMRGWTLGVVALMVIYAITVIVWSRWHRHRHILVWGLVLISLSALHVGLYAPMMEIGAYDQDVDLGNIPIKANVMSLALEVTIEQTFEGDMYFYYQSKSVVELIQTLLSQHNYVVGISILTFSILFPLAKLLLLVGFLVAPAIHRWAPLRFFASYSGKWSMADVFVVAIFLAYLAFENMQVGIPTTSNVMVGLYFFLTYCLVSITATAILNRENKNMTPTALDE